MMFQWDSFVHLAEKLISWEADDVREAIFRTAISRCYYGVFCLARNRLIARNIKIPKEDTHKFVIEQFKKSNNRMERAIGKNLNRLRYERNRADYDDKTDVDAKDAKLSLELAKRSLEGLRRLGAL